MMKSVIAIPALATAILASPLAPRNKTDIFDPAGPENGYRGTFADSAGCVTLLAGGGGGFDGVAASLGCRGGGSDDVAVPPWSSGDDEGGDDGRCRYRYTYVTSDDGSVHIVVVLDRGGRRCGTDVRAVDGRDVRETVAGVALACYSRYYGGSG